MKNMLLTHTLVPMTTSPLPRAAAVAVTFPAIAASAAATSFAVAAAGAASYGAGASAVATETTVPAMHLMGLACSPCPVAKKQDRKNNWHGRPLIGRGGIG